VALANPLAGIGVFVGERMLRKPLEAFSSARYHIGGTLDEPDVRFVRVFDVTPDPDAGDPAATAAGEVSSAEADPTYSDEKATEEPETRDE
jgi:hypothetical protein